MSIFSFIWHILTLLFTKKERLTTNIYTNGKYIRKRFWLFQNWQDSSSWTSETSENVYLFVFISSFVSFKYIYFFDVARNHRSSGPEVLCKKGVPRNFAKFTGKHMCQSLFFNKVGGLRLATSLKRDLAQVFSCEFCEVSKNTFSHRTPPSATSEIKLQIKHFC